MASPSLGGWPLLLAVVPWLGTPLTGSKRVRRSPLDIPLALFGLTAIVGALLAYDRAAAWNKAWLILCGVVLCLAISRQPREYLWPIAGGCAALAGVLAITFLLTRFAAAVALRGAGVWQWWSATVDMLLGGQAANAVQGILTSLLAFPIVVAMHAFRHPRARRGILAGMASVVTVVGLASTGTMSALWSLLGGCGLACAFGLGLMWRSRRRSAVAFLAIAALGVLMVAGIGIARWDHWRGSGASGALPGLRDVVSRIEIGRQSSFLIRDYFWTGAGLASFPGNYSQYIMMVPVFSQDSSHNAYVDVALEQGMFGLVALVWVWAASIHLLTRPRTADGADSLLVGATLSGLLLVALHGLAEDALYGTRAVPFLFLMPGFAAALDGRRSECGNEAASPRPARSAGNRNRWLLAAVAIALIAVGFGGPIASSVQSNLGALAMAQQQLTSWPTGEWDDDRDVATLRGAEAWFAKALASNADNPSAHYRLGLIDMLQRDFTGAVEHLSLAAQRYPRHRGVMKSQGFALCWAGFPDEAAQLLAAIPEARRELETYVWWWGNQGRFDLADRARQLAARLPPS